jgi:hypothetical protein
LHFFINETERGFTLEIRSEAVTSDPHEIIFPPEVWQSFSGREMLIQELAYCSVLATPLLLKADTVSFSTPRPRFLKFYNRCFINTLPNMVEDIPDEDSLTWKNNFRSLKRAFSGPPVKKALSLQGAGNKSVVIPFSFGKDSLLSMGLLHELDFDILPVVIDESMLPRAHRMKLERMKILEKSHGIRFTLVTNEIQLLSDFEILNTPPTRLYQVQAYFIYLLAMLPFSEYHNAPFLIMNNEYRMSLKYLHRENILTHYKHMQNRGIDREFDSLAKKMTRGKLSVINLIDGLGDFAIHYLLHHHYPELGKMRISCHMEITEYSHWCHDCYRCANAYLFTLALGDDPGEFGFEKSMLECDSRKHFKLFHPRDKDDDYRTFAAQEEMLAFLMAYEKGNREPLTEEFKKYFHGHAIEKRESLLKNVISNHSSPNRHPVKDEASVLINNKLKCFKDLM